MLKLIQKANDLATPLASAIGKGYLDIAEFLLKNGADINNLDKDNETPTMYCAQNGNPDIAKFVLQYKPNLAVRNKNGKTALDLAKEKNYTEVIKLIEENMNK